MANILIFGDSITYGAWDTEKGGWVQRLRSFFEKKNNMSDIFYNFGVSGNTTDDLLERLDLEVKFNTEEDWNKLIIIFSIGSNDCASFKNENKLLVEPDIFKKNILKLIKGGKKFTDKIIFLGLFSVDEPKVTPTPWDENIYYYNKDTKKYDSIIRSTCKQNDILFIDTLDLLDKNDFEDGLHPNAQGHQRIFEEVKNSLIKNKII